ncbi:insulinase family protein [Sphingomonas sp. MMS24-JH45]
MGAAAQDRPDRGRRLRRRQGDEAIAAIAKSFGALKPRKPGEDRSPDVRFPAHNATPVVRTHDGEGTQAAVIAWPTGGGSADHAEARRLDVLAAIFSDRLFDRLRSAASHSPSAQSQWPVGQPGGGRLIALGQVAPDKTGLFFKLSREIAAELVATPITEDELRRTVVPMLQYMARASSGNQFWLLQTQGATYDPQRIEASQSLVGDMTGIGTPQSPAGDRGEIPAAGIRIGR